uniref:Uncharacterized protein n=1 Tax=Rhizophora mucronata TaxID=61149 RepID=A0A2P2IHU1_RHIMU
MLYALCSSLAENCLWLCSFIGPHTGRFKRILPKYEKVKTRWFNC